MKCKMQRREKSLLFFNTRCVQILAFSPTNVFQIEQGLPFNVINNLYNLAVYRLP